MTPKTTGVHHIALRAQGLEHFRETVAFYRDLLGMPVVRTWGEGAAIGTMVAIGGGSMLEIFANADSRPAQGPLQHMALAVTDVDGCVAAVRAAGYPITAEPKDILIPSNPPLAARIAFCLGPVGEEIEFFQET